MRCPGLSSQIGEFRMATVEKELFVFPDPPEQDQVEWPGSPIGEANVITKTKARTLVSDNAIDAKTGRYEELLGSVTRYMDSPAGKADTRVHDVMVHGI